MIDRLRLGHFRNHAATRLEGAARFNLLVGENGAGKTNVLEALSLLAPGRGLRRAALADMAAMVVIQDMIHSQLRLLQIAVVVVVVLA